jgi:hypothetical protein
MCVKGNADKGVISAECLDPVVFFKNATAIGAPVNLLESITKVVSF